MDCKCLTGDDGVNDNYSPLKGDGYCHDELNIIQYRYDNGDCCGSCVIYDFCTKCTCIDADTDKRSLNALLGNGFCNDVTNNPECNYDYGDCCGAINTDYCYECICYFNNINDSCAAGSPPSTVGDGFCNDENNVQDCLFDGLDCCGYDHNDDGDYDDIFSWYDEFHADTTLCTECVCHGNIQGVT